MRRINTVLCIMALAAAVHAAPGKLVLSNGHCLKGDIRKLSDGGCWITQRTGSIKFSRDEIKSIVLYSDRDAVQEHFVTSFKITSASTAPRRSVSTPYDHLINDAARKNRVDPALVKAVIKAESNFNPSDTSHKGACGLMQLMPGTARILGVKNIYSPEENIGAGTRYLRDMLSLFNGDLEKALAAYNAGPGAVRKYRSVPPYRETSAYVRNVTRFYGSYRSPGRICSFTDDSGKLTLYNVR